MATYTDPKGKDWPIDFSDELLDEIKSLLDLDLSDLLDRERLQDPAVLLQVANVVCRDELATSRILPRSFRKRVKASPDDLRLAIEQAADEWQTEPEVEPEIESVERDLFETNPMMEE
jgi:hypothetical protein